MRRTDREITDRAEMNDILAKGDVCHLALVDQMLPYIVALNYGFSWCEDELVLYFHCARSGKKLDVIKKNNAGCFIIDIDHILVGGEKGCDWGMNFRSLVGRGLLEIITEPAERKKGLDLLMHHYSGKTGFSYDDKIFSVTTMLKLTVTELSAKKKE